MGLVQAALAWTGQTRKTQQNYDVAQHVNTGHLLI